jgi:hypothetical protein
MIQILIQYGRPVLSVLFHIMASSGTADAIGGVSKPWFQTHTTKLIVLVRPKISLAQYNCHWVLILPDDPDRCGLPRTADWYALRYCSISFNSNVLWPVTEKLELWSSKIGREPCDTFFFLYQEKSRRASKNPYNVVVLHPRRHLYRQMALHQEKSSQKRSDQSVDICTIFYEDTNADIAAD